MSGAQMQLTTLPSMDPRYIRNQKRLLAISMLEIESAKKMRATELAEAKVDRQLAAENIRREAAQ